MTGDDRRWQEMTGDGQRWPEMARDDKRFLSEPSSGNFKNIELNIWFQKDPRQKRT